MPRPRSISDDDILDAALDEIGRAGPVALTLAGVARRCSVTAPALVRRFGTKEALLVALMRRSTAQIPALGEAARAHVAGTAAITGFLTTLAGPLLDARTLANHLAFLQLAVSHEPYRREASAHGQAVRSALRVLVREARARGTLAAATSPDRLSRVLMRAYHGALVEWALHREGSAATALRRALDDAIAPWRMRVRGR